MSIEQHLIGGCLLAPDMIRFATKHVNSKDFYDVRLGGVFDVILTLQANRESLDAMTVATQAAKDGIRGVEYVDLAGYQMAVSSGASVEYYAQQVKEQAMRRSLQELSTRIASSAHNPEVPVTRILNAAMEDLKNAVKVGAGDDDGPKLLGDILAVEDVYEWVIPGMLEEGDRMLVTGFEGGGKSTWLRQIVVMAAAGLHPLTFDPIDPVRCLVVDVENSERQWRREVRDMVSVARRAGTGDPHQIPLRTDKQLNITLDSDLGKVHSWIDQYDPQLLMIGPLYKLVPGGIKGDEEASPVIAALDSIRQRGVALVLEGHAAKATGSDGVRNLSPRGSAALMGWPEFGLGLYFRPDEPEKVKLMRWRGDRQRRDWPREMFRGGVFPWTADTVTPEGRRRIGQR